MLFPVPRSDYTNSFVSPHTPVSHYNKHEGRFSMRALRFPTREQHRYPLCVLACAVASTLYACKVTPASTQKDALLLRGAPSYMLIYIGFPWFLVQTKL